MFYDKYIRLCAEKGISPSAAAVEIGLRKSNVTYWKNGRNNPTDATLLKIADYFGVTVEYLKTGEEKAPTQTGERSLEEEVAMVTEAYLKADKEQRAAILTLLTRK